MLDYEAVTTGCPICKGRHRYIIELQKTENWGASELGERNVSITLSFSCPRARGSYSHTFVLQDFAHSRIQSARVSSIEEFR